MSEARAWSLEAGLHPEIPADYVRLEEQLIFAQFLLSGSQPDTGLALLDRLRRSAEEDGRVVDAGHILVIEALAEQAQGQREAASHALTEAVALLEPSDHIRCFADEGPDLIGLLRGIAGSGAHFDYVSKILKAAGHRPPSPAADGDLPDPLSPRELEVLRLVAIGLSNREISDQLFISVPTVKRHISTILNKLSARSRTQAVSVARIHNLI